MPSGKYHPLPRRYGGLGTQRHAAIKVLADALGKSMGTAYDASLGTTVEVENWGIARSVWESFETNKRLSHVADPYRISGTILARWERISGISPDASASEPARRRPLIERAERDGMVPHAAKVEELLSELLGPVFVAVHHISIDDAVTWWPGGTPNPAAPWYSTTMHVPIQTVVPAGYSEAEYRAAIGLVHPLLDAIMPSHMTWVVYRNALGHSGAWTEDEGAGFVLDAPFNLDFQVFDQ